MLAPGRVSAFVPLSKNTNLHESKSEPLMILSCANEGILRHDDAWRLILRVLGFGSLPPGALRNLLGRELWHMLAQPLWRITRTTSGLMAVWRLMLLVSHIAQPF